jgi:hypothetical protein
MQLNNGRANEEMTNENARKGGNEMNKHMLILPVFLVAVVALVLGAAVPGVQAQDDDPVCWFNIELNATDLDVGVRGFFDYEPWKELEITAPAPVSSKIAHVDASSSLEEQGFAEWFFESGEPELSELSFSDFFDLFPDGTYVFDYVTIEDDVDDCEAVFTHVIPCAPEISASGNRGLGVTISWDPVIEVVDTVETDATGGTELVCVTPASALNIVGYEVIVENEAEKIYKIDLPGDATSVSVPPEFIADGEEYQYEVLAIEVSGNQTITEEEFCVNELNGIVEECNGDEE